MCWQCEQIDKEIERYYRLSARITDERSVKSLDILIANLEDKKRNLHIVEFKSPAKTSSPR